MRHVRDASNLHVAMLHGEPPTFHPDNPFENREAPLRWLVESAGEHPSDTIRDLERVASAELDSLTACLERGGDETYVGPYGPAHWTVLTTHVFWDAWLHQRAVIDALAGRGRAVETVLAGEPTRQQPFTLLRRFMSPAD